MPYSTPRVETTFSLAIRPPTQAVAARQLPKPRGAKTGATTPAMAASREVLVSSTAPNTPSVKP